ncbi:hypothetical protein F5Y06DRAFT_295282 [Hypoxylon sp. FL0890]|nr:hypothetical protein F5Y06DRAFT_295282 [Hypoxylon sp. FL0890]
MDVNGVALIVGADQDLDAASEGSEKSKSIATAADNQTVATAVDVRDRASRKGYGRRSQEEIRQA